MDSTRPFRLINVMAASVDGHIGLEPGQTDAARLASGFTSRADRQLLLAEVCEADAIIMGASSLRANPRLFEVKNRKQVYPHWFIVSKQGFAADLYFWQQNHIPRTIVSPAVLSAPPGVDPRSCDNLLVSAESSVAATIVARLTKLSYKRVLLFGGGYINPLFYAAGLVDELKLTLCPLLVGNEQAPRLLSGPLPQSGLALHLLSCTSDEGCVFLHYRVGK